MTAFRALVIAIVKGFLRDKTSVFFAVIFPLMFLVLFGGIFSDQSQSQVDLVAGRRRGAGRPAARGREEGVRRDFEVDAQRRPGRGARKVRKGDADARSRCSGDTLVAHYTQTDQVKAAITQGALRAFVDGTKSQRSAGGSRRRTPSTPSRSRTSRSGPSST